MKPFDIKAAIQGAPVVTRKGVRATVFAFVETAQVLPVAAYVEGSDRVDTFTSDGKFEPGVSREHHLDLFMATHTVTRYVNVGAKLSPDALHGASFYGGSGVYQSEAEARVAADYWGNLGWNHDAIAVPVAVEVQP